jgi:hypothetical protein
MESEEITTLAREIVTNVAYAAWNEDMLRCSFGPFLALAAPSISDEVASQIGLVWEHLAKAGYHGVNGYPSFLSCHFVHKDDVPLLQAEIRRMDDALGKSGEEAP